MNFLNNLNKIFMTKRNSDSENKDAGKRAKDGTGTNGNGGQGGPATNGNGGQAGAQVEPPRRITTFTQPGIIPAKAPPYKRGLHIHGEDIQGEVPVNTPAPAANATQPAHNNNPQQGH